MKSLCIHHLIIATILGISQLMATNLGAAEEERSYQLDAAAFQLVDNTDGSTRIQISGDYYEIGNPGDPSLPARTYSIAVPYDIDADSLSISYELGEPSIWHTTTLQRVRPFPQLNDDARAAGVRPIARRAQTSFPTEQVLVSGMLKMRKWRFVSVQFCPFTYSVETRSLAYSDHAVLHLSYRRNSASKALGEQTESILADTAMDARAARLFLNFDEAKPWYQPLAGFEKGKSQYDYVIITTNKIVHASHRLPYFLSYLMQKGFSPLIVTENDYQGLVPPRADGKDDHLAESIRKWLQNHYLSYGIEHVLLIGDPRPDNPSFANHLPGFGEDVGEVPMKLCFVDGPDMNEPIPTDHFYADLSSDWDYDGDGYAGELADDQVRRTFTNPIDHTSITLTYGLNFTNEVYVGRIPVYESSDPTIQYAEKLDATLQKIMNYGRTKFRLTRWRRSILLPMSFQDVVYKCFYFFEMNLFNWETDGAYVAEAMKNDFLDAGGFESYTMYMKGNACSQASSDFQADEALDATAYSVANHWQNHPYGVVFWFGHGGEDHTVSGFSRINCEETGGEHWRLSCDGPRFIGSSGPLGQDPNRPAFVFAASCLNGTPENSSNLAKTVLDHGGISVVAGTRVTYPYLGEWYYGMNSGIPSPSIGYDYVKKLMVDRAPSGEALFTTKTTIGARMLAHKNREGWINLMAFNLYGDPALSLYTASIR